MDFRRAGPILAALLVGTGAFFLLRQANLFTEMTDDGARDLLFARDCVELGKCHLIGPATSVRNIYQGADWVDLLITVKALGGDVDAARLVVLLLNAAAIATMFLVLLRWVWPPLALPSALLATGVLLSEPAGQLINPSAAIFPDVLSEALLLLFVLTSRTNYLLGAAIALGLAVNFHVAAAALVPSLLLLTSLASPRPIRDGLLATMLGALLAISSSWDGWYANASELIAHHHLVPILALLIVACIIATVLGDRFRKLPPSTRAWVTGLVLLLPFSVGILWLGRQEGHLFFRTYLHPVIAPGATLTVALATAPFLLLRRTRLRMLANLAPLALLGCLGWTQREAIANELKPRQEDNWRQSDLRGIAGWLAEHGWTYEQLLYRTEGPNCRELVTGAGVYLPPPKRGATIAPSRALRAVISPPNRAAAHDRFLLGDGREAALSEVASWLRPEELLACHVPPNGKAVECTHPPPRSPFENVEPESFEFLGRAFPGIYLQNSAPPYTIRYEIPVVPEGTTTRTIEVFDRSEPACIWRIVSVDNLAVDRPLPATRVTLHSTGAGTGKIAIEKLSGVGACAKVENRDYPPCLLETTPSEDTAPREEEPR